MTEVPYCDKCGKYILNKYKIIKLDENFIKDTRKKYIIKKSRFQKIYFLMQDIAENLIGLPNTNDIVCFCSKKCKTNFQNQVILRLKKK